VAYRIVSAFVLLFLIVFSFRTNPTVEFYHWGFWVGPMEQLRQGGWLLHDTPSQYGFLSILIPSALPGGAWISFWYYQAAIYAIVGALMFIIFRRLRGGVGNLLLSFLVVFTTLFFRPRSATLILPAQMTPSGGPVRFLWCFVLLGWLLLVFREAKGRREAGAGFPLVGHLAFSVHRVSDAARVCGKEGREDNRRDCCGPDEIRSRASSVSRGAVYPRVDDLQGRTRNGS
jgi:hypothetical protein